MRRTKDALTIEQILLWAEAHYQRTGRWPISRSGPLQEHPDRTWEAVNSALAKGGSGLPGGDSLSRLLKRARGVEHSRRAWPELTRKKILEWADYHHQCTGKWPDRDSGPVRGAAGISWITVDRYLKQGGAKLPGGASIATLLRDARGVWDGRGKPRLTITLILKWATEYHDATGRWPVTTSGSVLSRANEDWAAIDMALRFGRRGLPPGDSLSRLLTRELGDRYNPTLRELSTDEILGWADAFRRRHGRWPSRKSGQVNAGPNGLTWGAIDSRLHHGGRGLPGGTTLARLLDECRRSAAV